MNQISAIILAAGKGTRMKSRRSKVLHQIAGRPMLNYVLDAAHACGIEKIVVVVGSQSDDIREILRNENVEYAVQEHQLGTGHAVGSAAGNFKDCDGDILILCGDTPLITAPTLTEFIKRTNEQDSELSVLTGSPTDPFGYGRIVRDSAGSVIAIVEERDAGPDQKAIDEVNTGIYLADKNRLFALLENVTANNSQEEYYLTDVIAEMAQLGLPVFGHRLHNFDEVFGINSRVELAAASVLMWSRIRIKLMNDGVTLLDPNSAFVDSTVHIEPDTIIHPMTHLLGATRIGSNCVIESGTYVIDGIIEDDVKVLQGSRINCAYIGAGAIIGPMAHLRPDSRIGKRAKIGNFVEVKKTIFGDGSKASHLTYLGDSVIGENVNIGCGTITCNYDGSKKHQTTIGDGCFIGSDVQFIAPVKVGDRSLIGAGSTITKDVPPDSLAISRTRQKTYPLRKEQGSKITNEDK